MWSCVVFIPLLINASYIARITEAMLEPLHLCFTDAYYSNSKLLSETTRNAIYQSRYNKLQHLIGDGLMVWLTDILLVAKVDLLVPPAMENVINEFAVKMKELDDYTVGVMHAMREDFRSHIQPRGWIWKGEHQVDMRWVSNSQQSEYFKLVTEYQRAKQEADLIAKHEIEFPKVAKQGPVKQEAVLGADHENELDNVLGRSLFDISAEEMQKPDEPVKIVWFERHMTGIIVIGNFMGPVFAKGTDFLKRKMININEFNVAHGQVDVMQKLIGMHDQVLNLTLFMVVRSLAFIALALRMNWESPDETVADSFARAKARTLNHHQDIGFFEHSGLNVAIQRAPARESFYSKIRTLMPDLDAKYGLWLQNMDAMIESLSDSIHLEMDGSKLKANIVKE